MLKSASDTEIYSYKGGISSRFQEKVATGAETDRNKTEDEISAHFQTESAVDKLRKSSLSQSQESLISLTPSVKSSQSTKTKTTTISSHDSAHTAVAVSRENSDPETNQLEALSSRYTSTRYELGLEKYNDNAVIYCYFYITITNECFLKTNEN